MWLIMAGCAGLGDYEIELILIAILIMCILLFIDEFENLNRTIYFVMKESLAITTNHFDNIYSLIFY